MAQVSYGTITITDTNDIRRIYMQYCRSTSNQLSGTTVPGITVDWSESTPAWVDGEYIWQRAVIEKSGTLDKTYGTPVCITGAQGETGEQGPQGIQGGTGAAGRSLTSTTTQYTTAATSATITQSNMGSYTWSNNVPDYNASTPAYWVRITNVYSNPSSTQYIIYKDNGITDAVKTSHDANSTAAAANTTANNANTLANTANTTANNANTKADQAVTNVNNLQTRLSHYWRNQTSHTQGVNGWTKPSYPAGTYAASGIDGTTFDEENSSTYGYNTLYANGINLRYNAINLGQLTGTSLIFYHPSTSSQGGKAMELTGSALKFYDSTGSVAQATFGGTQATISGTINVYDGKIGNGSNYWYIGNYTDYNQNDSAIIKSIGTASIQLNETNTWRIATNRIHTAWAPESGTDAYKLHFPVFKDSENNNKHWDFGLHLPTSNSDKFLYIRNAASTQSLDNLLNDLDDAGYNYWTYKFYIDSEGNLHAGDIYSHGTLISGTSAPYLLKSGGTMTGSITMSNGGKFIGDVTGNVSGSASKLSNTSIIGNTNKPVYFTANGVPAAISYEINKSVPSNAIFTDENVNTTQANTSKLFLTGTTSSTATTGKLNFDSNVYLTTTAGTLHATTFEGNLSGTASRATADGDGNTIKTTYLKLSGGNVTGAVSFGSSVSADELTIGDLVVNGAASFTNNLQANTINGVAVGSNPKFTDTTYTFANGTNGFTVTPLGGTAQTVTVTPSIANNITGSGTSGYLAKFTGANTIGNGPALGSDTTKFLNNKGEWAVPTGTYTYTLPLAANGTRGGVQIGYSANGKNYPVQLDGEKMYVNVPWTDNNTTYTIATGDSNGQIKVTPSSGNAYNVNVKGLGSAAFVNTSLFPIVSTYSLPAAKAVRIQYPTFVPVLISAQRSNSGGRLILLGGGYGAEGTVRNDFQEIVSSSTNSFTWTLPSSSSISNSIEIMNVNTNGAATITVWTSAAVTFTEINALSNDAMNKVIVTSANYTNYTVTKTGSGASGTWGINVTGNAANVTGTVAIANGGTGKTTASDAINALLNGLPVWSANPTDTTYFIRQDTGGAASYGKVPATTLWNYISDKLPSWSKASSKPSYSYSEIGSAPDAIVDATVNSQGVIVLTKNSGGTVTLSTEIAVVESQGANKLVEAGSTTGISVGSSDKPVYFSSGIPVAGYYIPKLNGSNQSSAVSFYAPTAAGTAKQILVSSGSGAPGWQTVATGGTNGTIKIGSDEYAVKGLAAAAYKALADSSSASAIGTGTNVTTERDVYYGLPTINNAHNYTSSTTIYAPTAGGTSSQVLVGNGTTSAPVWTSISSLVPTSATNATNDSDGNPINTTYLKKTTYEYSKELSFGSSGKLLIGKFQCYDSNVTIHIQSTTNITYNAIAILATQNINTTGGGTFTWEVYGDANNNVTPNLYAKYASGSDFIEIYFSPSSWSKNLIHIQCLGLRSAPTNLCESITAIPEAANRQPTNMMVTKTGTGASGTWGINISGNAATASKLGSSNVGSARQAIYLSGGTATAGNYTVAHLGNAGKSNMNDVGRLHASVGMTNLTDPSNNTDNPMNGTTKSTSWHLYWNANYTDDPNGSNAWVAQIVNKAGTAQWWVRSRSGGTITNGTAWAADWKHLVVAPQAGQGSATIPIYIDANGHVQSITSYSGKAATAGTADSATNATNATYATYDASETGTTKTTIANKYLKLSGGTMSGNITMGSSSGIVYAANPVQFLRWTNSTTDNNSTGRSWYGIGTYSNADDNNYNWFNISNYWGINITTRGNTNLRHNNSIIPHTNNTSGTVGSATQPVYISGGVITAGTALGGAAYQAADYYVKKAGDSMTGPLKWNSTSLPQFSGAPSYLIGIDGFADGGTMKWQSVGNITVGSATKATQDKNGNDITTKYVTIDTDQTITASQKTFTGAIRWGNASKYGAAHYDSTLEAIVFSFA